MSETEAFDQIKTARNAAREVAEQIPVSGRGLVEPENFAQIADLAKFMSTSREAVPLHLRNNVGACLAVMEMARDFGFSAYRLANHTYVVNDRLAFDAQLMMAIINKHAGLRQRLRPEFEGEGDDMICIVKGHFHGELDSVEYRSPPIGTITPKRSPLWTVDPRQQLGYWSCRAFCRRFASHVLLGIYGRDELEDHIGPDRAIEVAGKELHDRLADAKAKTNGSAEGFHEEVIPEAWRAFLQDEPNEKVEDQPAPADTPPEPETKRGRGRPRKLPKNIEEYVSYCTAWINDATDPASVATRWNSERRLRNLCGLSEKERDPLEKLKSERIEQLNGSR